MGDDVRRPRVLMVCDFDPSSPFIGSLRVDRFATHLTSLGWSVRAVSPAGVTRYTADGKVAPAAAPRTHYTRPVRGGFSDRVHRMLLWVFYHLVAFPDRGVLTLRAILRRVRDLGDWRPDVVVVSGPPFATFLVGRRLARRWGVPWVADYRDLWTSSTYYLCGPLRRRLDRVVERRLVSDAALALTVSEPLAEDLRRDFGVRCEVVMNGYEAGELPAAAPGPAPGLPLRLVYTGEIYAGKRDPSALFAAIRRLGLGPETVRVDFAGITVLPIADLARAHGVEDVVHVRPAVPRAESLALQRSADVLLLLLWNHPDEVGIYSGKLFEYLGAGRPLLMTGYPEGVAARLVRERHAGRVANTVDELTAALEAWVREKTETGAVRGPGPAAAAGLTRRDQTLVLARLLDEVLAAHPGHDRGR